MNSLPETPSTAAKIPSTTTSIYSSGKNNVHDHQLPDKDQPAIHQVGSPYLLLFCKERRNSAFSIYQPDKSEIDHPVSEHLSSEYEDAQDEFDQPENRVSKKKDKTKLGKVETKNLNRYFRSKINEMLRGIKNSQENQEDQRKAEQLLNKLNNSNRIMFSEIREIIQDPWLFQKLNQCSGTLLRYVHGGKMGMHSKLIMLKYFNKIMKAIKSPEKFTCWK